MRNVVWVGLVLFLLVLSGFCWFLYSFPLISMLLCVFLLFFVFLPSFVPIPYLLWCRHWVIETLWGVPNE